MDKYLIEANFHVYVNQGEDQPEKQVDFSKGMIVEESDIPEGQSGKDWVAKGLAKAV